MENTVLLGSFRGKSCAALIEGKRLTEIVTAETEADNIYLGRVETVLPGMQAAFVNIGLDKNAFLPAENVPERAKLRPGMELAVQTIRVPGGEKGLRVSGYINLPGRLCVLTPFSKGVGVSKRIEDEAESARLREIATRLCPDGMGFIVRTNAQGASEEELTGDAAALISLWNDISVRSRYTKVPRLLYSGNDICEKTARELVNAETDKVVTDDDSLCERMKGLTDADVQKFTSDVPMFTLYGVGAQVDKALARRVWLDSGGYLIIDYTEALTVIDVNSGKFTGKSSLDDTAFAINTEAAREIAYQLRLRDVGGIIIIDFIDMDTEANRQRLLEILREELKRDKTTTNVVDITPLGLVEMTRKRRRERINDIFRPEGK